ncbi:hypothetical protein L7F22_059153 [Adiantum nelumboides]|nr:hypothetical protein [Adiantum nelumboides]
MDGYREFLRVPVSAGYYPSSRYPVSYSEPLYSTYPRAALDPYAGYGAHVSYPPEPLPPPQNSYPKKTPFKKTNKGSRVENFSSKGNQRKSDTKPPRKDQKDGGKSQKSPAINLAKETEELHKLFRTGVDSGKKIVQPAAKQTPNRKATANGVGRKRKADGEEKEAPSRKKNKGKKKKFSKQKKQEAKKDEKPAETPKAAKPEPASLTDEEKKEVELALELQKAACKAVTEFLGIPEKMQEPEPELQPEAEKIEVVQATGEEAHTTPTEAQDKPEEASKLPPALSAEEEKELEEKAISFFSKMLEENGELRKLYLDKKDAGTFECLVCQSVDAETSKKFANLTSLVMHTSMRKQKRPEHRGYGKAICDILGWESLRPKRPTKQAKVDGEDTKEVEAEKVVGETEEKQEVIKDDK